MYSIVMVDYHFPYSMESRKKDNRGIRFLHRDYQAWKLKVNPTDELGCVYNIRFGNSNSFVILEEALEDG